MYIPESKLSRQEESGLREAKRPWWCPQCGHSMIGKADDRMWILRGKCHRCVIREETQLRLEGKWESYEQERILSNQIAYIRDRISELKDIQRTISNPENLFSDGTFERWNVGVDKIKADLQDEINQLEHLLCEAERLYEEKFGAVGKQL
jgi:nuclear transport factor 2 (NTF2) superfamily protein